MIRKIKENDELEYLRLGQIINDNFHKLYPLKETYNTKYNYIYVYEDEKIKGFIHIIVSFDNADIVNIIVDEKYRNQHIASKLINYVIEEFNLKEINIEVNENNPAINFYKKIDFKKIRIIKNYYKDANAIFMKKVIK